MAEDKIKTELSGGSEHVRHRSRSRYYRPSVQRLRTILMFFMCVRLLVVPAFCGESLRAISGFVPLAFFFLSGYLVLRESPNRSARILRAIKRSAVTFAILAAAYFLLNFIYARLQGTDILSPLAAGELWFDFLVLNQWPFEIGSAIWYVQALLYAYVILYFLEKCDLLRYDGVIAAVLLPVTFLTSEVAAILPWSIWGHAYVPGNFLTLALPYLLLGSFVHRKMRNIINMKRLWFFLAVPAGLVITLLETLLLEFLGVTGYHGHLLGMGVVAVSVCLLATAKEDMSGFEKKLQMSRQQICWIYYLCQPVGFGITLVLSNLNWAPAEILLLFVNVITFLICFFFALSLARFSQRRKERKENQADGDPQEV